MRKILFLLLIFASCIPPREVRNRRDIVLRDETIEPDSITPQAEFIEREILMRSMQRSATTDTTTLVIPVVFHIVIASANGPENISDAQCQGALKMLNEQFGAYGIKGQPKIDNRQGQFIESDTTKDGKKRISMNIRFVMAAQDPQGNATNGIDRVDASMYPEYVLNGIRRLGSTLGMPDASVKALSVWDTNKYMNVWVVSEISGNNAGAGTMAYASLPLTTSAQTDGVVIQHTAFGTKLYATGTSNAVWENTFTHEVGHYLGLYHTFNATSVCRPETSPPTQGDRIPDTNPTTQSSACMDPAGCPKAPIGNFMGYTGHTFCQNIKTQGFTQDQRTRMRMQLTTYRAGLLNNGVLTPPQAINAGIELVVGTITCESSATPTAKITNYGTSTISSIVIFVNGSSITKSVSIPKGQSVTIDLPKMNLPSVGPYPLQVVISTVDGQVDAATDNNTASTTISRINGKDVVMTFTTDYYSAETSWVIYQGSTPVQFSPTYPNARNQVVTTSFCLAPGTYTLTMRDGHQDAQIGALTGSRAGFKLTGAKEQIESGPCWCGGDLCTTRKCGEKSYTFTVE